MGSSKESTGWDRGFMSVTYVERIFNINRRVAVVILQGPYAGRYPSRIEDIGDELLLAAPIHKGAIIRLSVGALIRVEISAEDGIYAFDTRVDSVVSEPVPFIQVKKPESSVRLQRREFVRVDLNLPVKYRPLRLAYQGPAEYKKAHIVNLSGGGAKIATWHPLENQEMTAEVRLELEFEVPDEGKVEAKAIVVRTFDEETERGVCRTAAVEFTEIDAKQQDAIVRYVLRYQYELRRKGLL